MDGRPICSTTSVVVVRLLLSLGTHSVAPFLVNSSRLCAVLSNVTQQRHPAKDLASVGGTFAIPAAPSCQGPGFRGWHIRSETGAFIVRGEGSVDELLLGHTALAALPDSHRAYLRSATLLQAQQQARAFDDGDAMCKHASDLVDAVVLQPPTSSRKRAACSVVKVGPDDPRRIAFSPSTDLDGCFVTNVETNNCYNYACDILTNSIAQPGDGSGLCPTGHPGCIPSTCADVRRAATSDGLIWIGSERPSSLPPEGGHFVSLHMWEGESFHWLRMDNTTTWSQKDGDQPMKDTDNAGQPIVDPAAADLRPFTQHCGYMRVVPSNVTIL